jgi:hypothetical protein
MKRFKDLIFSKLSNRTTVIISRYVDEMQGPVFCFLPLCCLVVIETLIKYSVVCIVCYNIIVNFVTDSWK